MVEESCVLVIPTTNTRSSPLALWVIWTPMRVCPSRSPWAHRLRLRVSRVRVLGNPYLFPNSKYLASPTSSLPMLVNILIAWIYRRLDNSRLIFLRICRPIENNSVLEITSVRLMQQSSNLVDKSLRKIKPTRVEKPLNRTPNWKWTRIKHFFVRSRFTTSWWAVDE